MCPPPPLLLGRERKEAGAAHCLGLLPPPAREGVSPALPSCCCSGGWAAGGTLGWGGCQSWGLWLEEGPLVGSREQGQLPALAPGNGGGARGQVCSGSACSSCPAEGQGLQPVPPWLLPAPRLGWGALGQALLARRGARVGSARCLVSVSSSGCCHSCLSPLLLCPLPHRRPCLVTPLPYALPTLQGTVTLSTPPTLPWPGGIIPPCFPQQQ